MKVNVKGQTYTITEEDLSDCHGKCNTDTYLITIDNSEKTKGNLRRITLAHELTHAYLKELYITDIISPDLEEILCEMVAHLIDRHGQMILDFD
jgi:hypothetical protein